MQGGVRVLRWCTTFLWYLNYFCWEIDYHQLKDIKTTTICEMWGYYFFLQFTCSKEGKRWNQNIPAEVPHVCRLRVRLVRKQNPQRQITKWQQEDQRRQFIEEGVAQPSYHRHENKRTARNRRNILQGTHKHTLTGVFMNIINCITWSELITLRATPKQISFMRCRGVPILIKKKDFWDFENTSSTRKLKKKVLKEGGEKDF